MKQTAVFDIDGVIATGSPEEVYSDAAGWAYGKCLPIRPCIELIKRLRQNGLLVVLHTARFECDREVTEEWLERHGVEYDSLVMGKPQGAVYLDDRSYPHPFLGLEERDWDETFRNIVARVEAKRLV